MKRRQFLSVVLVPFVALAACAGDDDGSDVPITDARADMWTAATDVAVVDNEFEPAVITVDRGDTVTWTWTESNPHDVAGDGFESQIQTSGSFQHTFDVAGEFEYVCTVHPQMDGRVVVR